MVSNVIKSLLLLLLLCSGIHAQSPMDTIAMRAIMINQLFPQERVYLHFDNTSYYLGETIWFKAYVVGGNDYSASFLSKVLYVELCAPEGYVVETKKYKLDDNGCCHGEFELHPSLFSGYYEVRAYTRYMLNWGDEVVFSRVFPVYDAVSGGHYEIKDMLNRRRGFLYRGEWHSPDTDKYKLTFYPEGGHLVYGLKSAVAYELSGPGGAPSNGTVVLYEDGRLLLRTSPLHRGKGRFEMIPRKGVRYTARVETSQGVREFDMPAIEDYGVILNVSADSSLIVISVTNNLPDDAPLACAVLNKGYMQHYSTFDSSAKQNVVVLCRDSLPQGVNRAIIFGSGDKPIAERQFFVQHKVLGNEELKAVKLNVTANGIAVDSLSLHPNSRLTLKIEREDGKPIDEKSDFSLAVVDAGKVESSNYRHNIYTWLLLGSELKGYIPDVGNYFDEENIHRYEQLDLLMLTHGWTSYDWSMLNKKIITLKQPIETGITIKGTIFDTFTSERFGHIGEPLITPRRFGCMGYMPLSDTVSNRKYTPFFANCNGNFKVNVPDFYGTVPVDIVSVKNKSRSHFILDRLFAPKFKFFSFWETDAGAFTKQMNDELDTTVVWMDTLQYRLGELDVSVKKRSARLYRPPHSEMRHNYLDEWEYATDVTYGPDIKDYIDLHDENTFVVDPTALNNDIYYDSYMLDGSDLPVYDGVGFVGVDKVLESTFWRHNYNWAYWVQSVVVKGGYDASRVPVADWDILKSGFHEENAHTYLKEFFIRSDLNTRREYENSVERWCSYKNDVQTRLVKGFTKRMYIPTPDYKKIDGFPGKSLFYIYMRGNALEWTTDSFPYHRGAGSYNPQNPNYVACFVPYSQDDKKNKVIPNLNASNHRYTSLQGYTQSKQFYSPDYSAVALPDSIKDYRRTLFWAPSLKPDSAGCLTAELYSNSSCRNIAISVEGSGNGTVYGNNLNSTLHTDAGINDTLPHIALWHKLSKTSADPVLMAKCYRLTNDGVALFYTGKFEEAVEKFKRAASLMYPSALANLGLCYALGRGVEENEKTAYRYFKFAADLGNPTGLFYMGDSHLHGRVAQQNDSLAFEYFNQAALKGYKRAYRMVGQCYKEGVGVAPDYEQALNYYERAIKEKDRQAMYEAAIIYMHYDSVAGVKGRKLRKSRAAELVKSAAKYGIMEAQLMLVDWYEGGGYVRKSNKKRFRYLNYIANRWQHAPSMMQLAYCYEKGIGVSQNHFVANKYYTMLANNGDKFAAAKVKEYATFGFFDYYSPKPPEMK